MSILSRWRKPKFNDEQINARAETAIAEDPLITNVTSLGVISKEGIVTITGTVASDRQKNHIEGTVRSALKQSGLKFYRLDNNLVIDK